MHAGRPYLLWLPQSPPPWPGMVIVHGAGSRKENHGDFGRACAASGWAGRRVRPARTRRVRGRHEPRGARGRRPRWPPSLPTLDGVDAKRVCVRGSSMGGFMAIEAAASSEAIAGAIAICPAGSRPPAARALRAERLEMRIDPGGRESLEAWLAEHDLRAGGGADGLQAAAPDPRPRRRPDPLGVVRGALRAGGRSRASSSSCPAATIARPSTTRSSTASPCDGSSGSSAACSRVARHA